MHGRLSRSGVTLVEVIVALAIGAVVMTLAFSVYHLTTRSISSQIEWRSHGGAGAVVMDRILRDIVCTVADNARMRSGFAVLRDGARNSSLHMYTAEADPGVEALERHRVYRVRYSLVRGGGKATRLEREASLAAEGGVALEAVKELMEGDLAGFRVQVFDGETWHDQWSGETLPLAARVHLEFDPPHEDVVAETLIPVGQRLSSGP